MHSISDHVPADQCPKVICVQRHGTAYIHLDTILERAHLSEHRQILTERCKAEFQALSAYGKIYLEASLVSTLLIKIIPQLPEEGLDGAAEMMAMSQFVAQALHVLHNRCGEEKTQMPTFKLGLGWLTVQDVDELPAGETPGGGPGLLPNTTVTINSHTVH